jgi:hypothetical protein
MDMVPTTTLEVRTTTVHPRVTVSQQRVDFGELPVGQSSLIKVTVTSHIDTTTSLSAEPLNAAAVFSVVNALRHLAPHASQELLLQFSPKDEGDYHEVLRLSTVGGLAIVDLRGRGVSPRLVLEPADGVVNLGNVLIGDAAVGMWGPCRMC